MDGEKHIHSDLQGQKEIQIRIHCRGKKLEPCNEGTRVGYSTSVKVVTYILLFTDACNIDKKGDIID